MLAGPWGFSQAVMSEFSMLLEKFLEFSGHIKIFTIGGRM